jgi:hypothetical protein
VGVEGKRASDAPSKGTAHHEIQRNQLWQLISENLTGHEASEMVAHTLGCHLAGNKFAREQSSGRP